jgi:hypothetical protein
VNWKLGASHLPEGCWKGGGEEGNGSGQTQLPPPSSFLHSEVRMLGSVTKVSGQKRLRLLYRRFSPSLYSLPSPTLGNLHKDSVLVWSIPHIPSLCGPLIQTSFTNISKYYRFGGTRCLHRQRCRKLFQYVIYDVTQWVAIICPPVPSFHFVPNIVLTSLFSDILYARLRSSKTCDLDWSIM